MTAARHLPLPAPKAPPLPEVSEVMVELAREPGLCLAYASALIGGCFLVKELKVVTGRGGLFVSMPGRALMHRCPNCNRKNSHLSFYCCECGRRLPEPPQEARGHRDVAHPTTAAFREALTQAVLDAYRAALDAAQEIGPKAAVGGHGSPAVTTREVDRPNGTAGGSFSQ